MRVSARRAPDRDAQKSNALHRQNALLRLPALAQYVLRLW